jgi:ribosome-associated toxin RatA of RatAB toxin-antitoxin module
VQHEHTEHVAAPAEAVYAAISDLSNLPRFVPQMTAARQAAGDRVETTRATTDTSSTARRRSGWMTTSAASNGALRAATTGG